MTGEQALACVHQYLGMWPVAEPTDDETMALVGIVSQYERREFDEAVAQLSVDPGPLRPPPTVLQAALRAARARQAEKRPKLPEAPPAADPLSWVARGREALREALRRVGGKPTP